MAGNLDRATSRMLQKACGVSELIADLMVTRGIETKEEAQRFLYPDINQDWTDPLLIPGMEAVADALERAVRAKKRILIFGDFDVDGISATAVMVRGLAALGTSVEYLIPNRIEEGYGLTASALTRIYDIDPEVVVTVDCGISARNEIDEMLARGIEVLVTDHHEPSENVPGNIPVADPKLEDDSPLSILAGAAVALKLIAVLGNRMGMPELWRDLLDLAALGTLADVMPLTAENRVLVAAGIAQMEAGPRLGLAAVFASIGDTGEPLESTFLAYSLIPRLNAAGRMGDPTLALRLLLSDDPCEAQDLARELEQMNRTRRLTEAEVLDKALIQAVQREDGHQIVIVSGEGWHEGVKGIVASRLVKRFQKPAIVFTQVGEELRGSGRSIGSVNLFKAIEQCADLAIRFGGHEAAVGITLSKDRLGEFIERMGAIIEEEPPENFSVHRQVDGEVRLSNIDLLAVKQLRLFEPFGRGNEEPLFISRAVYLQNKRAVGGNKDHLACFVSDGLAGSNAIYFKCPQIEDVLSYEGKADIVYRLKLDEWNGRMRPKLYIEKAFLETNEEPAIEDDASLIESLPGKIVGHDVQLHESQKNALEALVRGDSVLAIMATGRGKSLIFQTYAALLAKQRKAASVFIYPLRALIADQAHSLAESYKRIGLHASSLTGDNSTAEKDRIFQGLYEGELDVLLTTPEFFQLHAWRFEGSGRIEFIVFDEAHHIATELQVGREAYHHLRACRTLFPRAQFLAVTATADDRISKGICQALAIDKTIIDATTRENLILNDVRNLHDREGFVASTIMNASKAVVYTNSRAQVIELARFLRKQASEINHPIAFYHAGLKKEERRSIEDAFREGAVRTIIATSAFGEGINIPDISDVILYHLPFSAVAFNQMSGRVGRNGERATIHLAFNEEDAQINRQILKQSAPSRDDLAVLYRALRSLDVSDSPATLIRCSCKELVGICKRVDSETSIEEKWVINYLAILEELSLLELETEDDRLSITLFCEKGKVELSASSRYLEGKEELVLFEDFREWVFRATAEELREKIIGPLAPTGNECER